jgi:hypothetical protein
MKYLGTVKSVDCYAMLREEVGNHQAKCTAVSVDFTPAKNVCFFCLQVPNGASALSFCFDPVSHCGWRFGLSTGFFSSLSG